MKGEPALVVGLVDAGSVLHQESHHVDVVVDARLRRETGEMGCKNGAQSCPAAHVHASSRRCDSWCYSFRKRALQRS